MQRCPTFSSTVAENLGESSGSGFSVTGVSKQKPGRNTCRGTESGVLHTMNDTRQSYVQASMGRRRPYYHQVAHPATETLRCLNFGYIALNYGRATNNRDVMSSCSNWYFSNIATVS